MSQDDNTGLMSSSGLVRYFESEEDKSLQLDPKTVTSIGFFAGIFVLVLNSLF